MKRLLFCVAGGVAEDPCPAFVVRAAERPLPRFAVAGWRRQEEVRTIEEVGAECCCRAGDGLVEIFAGPAGVPAISRHGGGGGGVPGFES